MNDDRFLDDVVAANVRRLREERNLSVIELANLLNVRRELVYDYERKRAGRQRPFHLVDLYRLCVGLDVTLFDLLLPPPGPESDEIYATNVESADEREGIGLELFGMPPDLLTTETLKAFIERRDDYEKRMTRLFERALAQIKEMEE